jgi:hypothetical protein
MHMKIPQQLHQLKIVDNQQQMVTDIHYLKIRHLKMLEHIHHRQVGLSQPLDLMLDMGFHCPHCLNIRHQLKMVIDNHYSNKHLKIVSDTHYSNTSLHKLEENRQVGLPLDLMLDMGFQKELVVRNIQQQGIVDQRRQFVETNMRSEMNIDYPGMNTEPEMKHQRKEDN